MDVVSALLYIYRRTNRLVSPILPAVLYYVILARRAQIIRPDKKLSIQAEQ